MTSRKRRLQLRRKRKREKERVQVWVRPPRNGFPFATIYRPKLFRARLVGLRSLIGSVTAPVDWATEHDHYASGAPKRCP